MSAESPPSPEPTPEPLAWVWGWATTSPSHDHPDAADLCVHVRPPITISRSPAGFEADLALQITNHSSASVTLTSITVTLARAEPIVEAALAPKLELEPRSSRRIWLAIRLDAGREMMLRGPTRDCSVDVRGALTFTTPAGSDLRTIDARSCAVDVRGARSESAFHRRP